MNVGCQNCILIPTKACLYRVQLFIMFPVLILIYYMMYIYAYPGNISCKQTLQSERINDKKDIVLQTDVKRNIDLALKFVIEAKQNLKLPDKTDDVDKNTNSSQKIINQRKAALPVKPADRLKQNQNINKDVDKYKVVISTDGVKESKNSDNQQEAKPSNKPKEMQIANQHRNQEKLVKPTDGIKESKNSTNQQKEKPSSKLKEVQKANQSTNQQKVVKLCDPSDSEKEHSNQKDNNQIEKANGKPDQVNQNQTCRDPEINATHINGTLMEPVNVNYTRNIYFSVKTTHKYYTERLFLLMLTWLQTVDKNKLSLITDKSTAEQVYVDIFRKAGFNIIDTGCFPTHSRRGLWCKMGTEFAAYYKALEEHPGEEDKYQWFCHSDDDVYVNVLELSRFLKQYNPHKPYYVGKFPQFYYKLPYIPINNWTINHFSRDMHLPLKKTLYEYATGSTFCVSQAIMMEAKRFINGPNQLKRMGNSAKPSPPDDMIVGFIFTALLGYNLTNVRNITNEYDHFVKNSSLPSLINYITISIESTESAVSLSKFASLLKTPLPLADPTRVLLYHCLLYPTISWCNSVKEKLALNDNDNIYVDQ